MPTRQVVLLPALMLAGCATMTATECQFADWTRIGEADARSGQDTQFVFRRAEDCTKAGFPADIAAWRRGWDFGIVDWCQPQIGFDRGLSGHGHHGQCPPGLEVTFAQAHRLGWDIHSTRQAIRDEDVAIRDLDKQLAEDEDLDDRMRRRLRRELERRRSDLRQLERQLGGQEAEARMLGYSPGYWRP